MIASSQRIRVPCGMLLLATRPLPLLGTSFKSYMLSVVSEVVLFVARLDVRCNMV